MAAQSVALSAYRKVLVAYLKAADVVRVAADEATAVEQQQMRAFLALGRERGLVNDAERVTDPAAVIELQRQELVLALKTLGWDEEHPIAQAAIKMLVQLRKEVDLYEQLQAAQLDRASGDGPVL